MGIQQQVTDGIRIGDICAALTVFPLETAKFISTVKAVPQRPPKLLLGARTRYNFTEEPKRLLRGSSSRTPPFFWGTGEEDPEDEHIKRGDPFEGAPLDSTDDTGVRVQPLVVPIKGIASVPREHGDSFVASVVAHCIGTGDFNLCSCEAMELVIQYQWASFGTLQKSSAKESVVAFGLLLIWESNSI